MKAGGEQEDAQGFTPDEEALDSELDSLYRKVASLDLPQVSAKDREEAEPQGADPYKRAVSDMQHAVTTQKPIRQSFRALFISSSHYWIFGAVLTIIVAATVVFDFWPNLYYYEIIKTNSKIFPLRINKFTASTSFYDGKDWVTPPLLETLRSQDSHPLVSNSPNRSRSATPPAEVTIPPPDVPPTVSSSAPLVAAGGAISSGTDIKGEAAQSLPPVNATGKQKNSFSIQIASFQEDDKALAWAKSLEAKKTTARVVTVNLQKKGIWHRVLIGRFDCEKDAYRYIEMYQLRKKYPDCFIRNDQYNQKSDQT